MKLNLGCPKRKQVLPLLKIRMGFNIIRKESNNYIKMIINEKNNYSRKESRRSSKKDMNN
jgi:hypothetical protein